MEKRPPPYATDPEVLQGEIVVTVFRASGPGGQHRNRRESAVRIHHPPSGVVVIATEHRTQGRNRALAMERLVERLRLLNRRPKARRATRRPRRVHEDRLARKRRRAEVKRLRRRPAED